MLISNNKVKLADFGSSQMFCGEDTIFKHRGTMMFLAPECFKSSNQIATLFYSGRKADIWALGMTVWALVFNELPFKTSENEDIGSIIQALEISCENQQRKVSEKLSDFLMKMLDKNPQERWLTQSL